MGRARDGPARPATGDRNRDSPRPPAAHAPAGFRNNRRMRYGLLFLIFFVLYCFEAGLFLVVAPWNTA